MARLDKAWKAISIVEWYKRCTKKNEMTTKIGLNSNKRRVSKSC